MSVARALPQKQSQSAHCTPCKVQAAMKWLHVALQSLACENKITLSINIFYQYPFCSSPLLDLLASQAVSPEPNKLSVTMALSSVALLSSPCTSALRPQPRCRAQPCVVRAQSQPAQRTAASGLLCGVIGVAASLSLMVRSRLARIAASRAVSIDPDLGD